MHDSYVLKDRQYELLYLSFFSDSRKRGGEKNEPNQSFIRPDLNHRLQFPKGLGSRILTFSIQLGARLE